MRILDDRFFAEGREAALDAVDNLGLSPVEAIPGLVGAITTLSYLVQEDGVQKRSQALDEVVEMLEEEDDPIQGE